MSKENRKLHEEWRKKVYARDKWCQICGPVAYGTVPTTGVVLYQKQKRLNAHHLIPKEFKEYRWDVDNGMTLCVHHHTLGRFSAHKNPVWFNQWLRNCRPEILKLALLRLAKL